MRNQSTGFACLISHSPGLGLFRLIIILHNRLLLQPSLLQLLLLLRPQPRNRKPRLHTPNIPILPHQLLDNRLLIVRVKPTPSFVPLKHVEHGRVVRVATDAIIHGPGLLGRIGSGGGLSIYGFQRVSVFRVSVDRAVDAKIVVLGQRGKGGGEAFGVCGAGAGRAEEGVWGRDRRHTRFRPRDARLFFLRAGESRERVGRIAGSAAQATYVFTG